MHDALDLGDLVVDEAEELLHSGYPAGDLLTEARTAADHGDRQRLAEIETLLAALPRLPDWPWQESETEDRLRERCAAVGALPVQPTAVADRIAGGWHGRAVGNTLGKPVEGLSRIEVENYLRAAGQWPLGGYLPLLSPLPDGVEGLHPSAPIATAGRFTAVPRDDDLDWTMLALCVVEQYGPEFSTEQLAATWLDRMPFTQTYTAERVAYRNLVGGLTAPATATERNPYREWIGALIRTDLYGYLNPGDPGAAAATAITDARLSHTGNGLYGGMWAAALVASALAADSARDAVERSLEVLPPQSRLVAAVGDVLTLHAHGATATDALDAIDRDLGHYNWVHTINNAAQIAAGLLWGESLIEAVGITLQGGRDTDSNCATVGSVYGALHGSAAVPEELIIERPVRLRSAVRDFDGIELDELVRRTLQLARRA